MLDATQSRRPVARTKIIEIRHGKRRRRSDRLAGEEPMEIRVGGAGEEPAPVAVTMRTPGNDFELAVGFLFTEGLLDPASLTKVSYCDSLDADQNYNVVTVRTATPFDAEALKRNFYTTSSCGICGKASLDDVEVRCAPLGGGPEVTLDVVAGLPETLRSSQRVFDATGGLHAAALFGSDGTLVAMREDVGRHNAVDKVIGRALLAGAPDFGRQLMMVSGRASFEIVQKAAVGGVPVLCAVSAPSSLAVSAADRLGLTLIGFLRDSGCNVYTHPERIIDL
jgi:FdhD protein